MRYFSCPREIMALEIVNILNRGDATPRNVIRLAKLFPAYLLVLLNKYRCFINIPRGTGKPLI